MYASDASLYRARRWRSGRSRDVDEVATTLSVVRDHEVPLTCRGAGTWVAGHAIGRGVVLDLSRQLGRVGPSHHEGFWSSESRADLFESGRGCEAEERS